ncbi:MAG: heme biosynthesis protein HemY, partial [Oceanobacter sp.]
RKKTMQGLISMAQGQWSRAERQLTRSADDTDIPLINYLAAAKAAYEQGHHEATSDLLQRASKTTRGAELPAGMAKAQFLISRDQPEQALAVLVSLRDKYPRHSYLLKVLVRLYEKLEDWVALKNLLPVLGKSGPYSAEQLHELSIKVYVQLIDRLMHGHSDLDQAHELKAMFHGLPRNYRKSRRVLLAYGKALHQLGKDELAEVELRTGLKHAWSDELIELYGELITPETGRQKLFAEKQLTERPNDPTLLLVLARLSVRTGELDQANEYVETGLSLKPTAGLLTLQADILAASEQFQQAAEIYKKAMELTERQQG